MKYTIIKTDGSTREGDVAEHDVEKLWRSISDGYMEHVRVFLENEYRSMIVDEEGKLKGLPFNPTATAIYWNNVMAHDPDRFDPNEMDTIAGDAILFDRMLR